jgi:pimeloyl-ACP methyl ester carboxylesterase
MKDRTNIWEFRGTLSKPLLVWAAGSTLSGFSLVVPAPGFWDGFGIQALAWGVIDGLIAGKQGYRSARSIGIPTLVIQGTEDALVRPRHTRLLAPRLAAARPQRGLHDGPSSSGITRYLEIPGGHNIIDRDQPGWDRLEQALVEFSRSVKDGERKRT